jgi:hypothetical protein
MACKAVKIETRRELIEIRKKSPAIIPDDTSALLPKIMVYTRENIKNRKTSADGRKMAG